MMIRLAAFPPLIMRASSYSNDRVSLNPTHLEIISSTMHTPSCSYRTKWGGRILHLGMAPRMLSLHLFALEPSIAKWEVLP